VAWWTSAHRAGHLVHLEARLPDDDVLAGLLLYRHGRRLTTVHSGDHDTARKDHPGALHLLRWRAIQLAIREARDEMDLGGVDVAGARHEPKEGDPTYGLYQHKRSFGAQWVELAGAHEKVIRANHYRAGRVMSRLSRILDRRPTAEEAAAAE
jgi:lipid II:glycine glycyltransferase (peptidoglycan interpeptide bridge formation enzyme)